ncbi:hypothetical protein SLEP1_g17999 [Rubroshorea leprosula]|uniref:Uncharacterized protein n=1 Tax=Rubroshorea leprosula TaxID=152421 RepID=A0AAV5J7U1_9ROSI|nr:hypothetical protein SLEP1_g17999 [Rubroshorea leprosula]
MAIANLGNFTVCQPKPFLCTCSMLLVSPDSATIALLRSVSLAAAAGHAYASLDPGDVN